MGFIRKYFRKRALAKWASPVATAMMPFEDIKSVAVLLDVEDPVFMDTEAAVSSWFKRFGIRLDIHYFDFRRLEKNEMLTTSIQSTVLKKDLNWFGMPDPGHTCEIDEDLFISLVNNTLFPTRFYATCCRCRFKIGRSSWDNSPFDIVVNGDESSTALQVFDKMKEYLALIAPAGGNDSDINV